MHVGILFFAVLWGRVYGKMDHHLSIKDMLSENYDKRLRPGEGERPVNITVQIEIITLGPIDEHKFAYKIDYYQRIWWKEDRLKMPENRTVKVKDLKWNTPPEDTLWTPSIVVKNAGETKADPHIRSIIDVHGNIYVSQRKKSTCTCEMNLKYFPMDTQVCPFIIEDFNFRASDLILQWHELPFIWHHENNYVAGYQLKKITQHRFKTFYRVGGEEEIFDQLQLHIQATRSFTHVLYRTYIPSMLLMVFNIASYWIPDTAVPARIGLIVTTFLTNTFILQSVTEQTVQVPYTTSLQIFLLGNVVILVISIVEYLFVLYFKAIKVGSNHEVSSVESTSEDQANLLKKQLILSRLRSSGRWSIFSRLEPFHIKKVADTHNVDRAARVIVPFMYVTFCLVYFTLYFGMKPDL